MTVPRPIGRVWLDRLAELYAEIDARAGALHARLESCLVCRRGCSDCCQDDLTVLEIEAAWILAHRHRWADPAGDPHPPGRCAFLDDTGACRIYRWRPYVCRTQGLPLRWCDESGEEAGRSTCPLNEDEMGRRGRSLAGLTPGDCWTLGEFEARLASLQAEATGEFAPRRIRLRSLFTTD